MKHQWKAREYELRMCAIRLTEQGRYYMDNYLPVRVDDKTVKLVRRK